MSLDCKEGEEYKCPYLKGCKSNYGNITYMDGFRSTEEIKKFFQDIKYGDNIWGKISGWSKLCICQPGLEKKAKDEAER